MMLRKEYVMRIANDYRYRFRFDCDELVIQHSDATVCIGRKDIDAFVRALNDFVDEERKERKL